jgi:hypothetical protein
VEAGEQAEQLREQTRSGLLVSRGHDGVVERDGHDDLQFCRIRLRRQLRCGLLSRSRRKASHLVQRRYLATLECRGLELQAQFACAAPGPLQLRVCRLSRDLGGGKAIRVECASSSPQPLQKRRHVHQAVLVVAGEHVHDNVDPYPEGRFTPQMPKELTLARASRQPFGTVP